ncbi:MAG TPA: hypothetical protein DEF05_06650 [Erwinia sp.]|nr:hypothetical protein [Erwinia sp.]
MSGIHQTDRGLLRFALAATHSVPPAFANQRDGLFTLINTQLLLIITISGKCLQTFPLIRASRPAQENKDVVMAYFKTADTRACMIFSGTAFVFTLNRLRHAACLFCL